MILIANLGYECRDINIPRCGIVGIRLEMINIQVISKLKVSQTFSSLFEVVANLDRARPCSNLAWRASWINLLFALFCKKYIILSLQMGGAPLLIPWHPLRL